MGEARIIRQDVRALVALARQRDDKARRALYLETVKLLEGEHRNLSEVERGLICDILRRLTHSVEMAIRRELAERLAGDDNAPVDLILLLANDQIEVAHSVLLYSKLLSDTALIEIIRHKTIQHQMRIAARQNLSAPVSSALVRAGDNGVIVALLANPTAAISDHSFAEIVRRSAEVAEFQAPLVAREDLPPSLAARLYAVVSEDLKRQLAASFRIDNKTIDRALAESVDSLARGQVQASTGDGLQRLLDKLEGAGQLTPGFVVKCLNQGQIELFERAFARLVNMAPHLFPRFLYDYGPEGLAVACRAAGIDRSVFLTMYRITRMARGHSADLADLDTARIFELFESLDQRGALLRLHNWAAEEARSVRLI